MKVNRKNRSQDLNSDMRQEARRRLKGLDAEVGVPGQTDHWDLVEELEIHRAELLVQNEDLGQAQEALREARDRYRDLYERAPVGFLTLDSHGRIGEANLRAAELLGTDRDWLAGHSLASLVTPESQDAYHLHRRALARGRGRQVTELELQTPQGERLVARLESEPEPDADPAEPRYRCALTEITARKQAEEALEWERDQLERRVTERTRELQELRGHREQLLASLGEGLLGLDADGRFTFLNPYAVQALGADRPDELIGEVSYGLLYPDAGDYPEERDLPIQQVLATGESQGPWQDRFTRADGSQFPVEVFANPVWEGEELAGAVVMFTDLSERLAFLDKLSPREQEVLELLVRGLTNKQVAKELAISHRTVEVHRAHLMAKLEVGSFAELMRRLHS